MRLLFLGALLSMAAGTVVVVAKEQPATKPATTAPSTQAADRNAVNKFCAVERDNEVDPKVFTVYKGKVIGFCCQDCIKDFEKDPDKYVKNMK